MAIARDTTVANIKPLDGAKVRRYTAGATIAPGEIVEMQSDGFIDPTNTTSAAVKARGIALVPRNQGSTFASGDLVDVVVFGPVQCITGGTPGAVCYASDTAGEPSESAGTNFGVVGEVEAATVVFVNPVVAVA